MSSPLISVIVPTRSRRESLHRLLRALHDDRSAPPFEIVVVDDGSTDDTVASLQPLQTRHAITVVNSGGAGPAAARNAGAHAARGTLLLFLDDDVEPNAGTLAAHARFHENRDDFVGVGDLPPLVESVGFFGMVLRGWWEMMLASIQQPGHRFEFKNLLTGHVSIRRAQFLRLGGFDPHLRCHEDWEFGYRALKGGLQMRFVPGAVAWHHETSDLAKVLRRKFEEGVADIQLTERHPELAPTFPYAWTLPSRKARVVKKLTLVTPPLAAATAWGLSKLLPLYESVKLRFRWRESLELLLVHHYWRGVRSVVPDRHAVSSLAKTAAPVKSSPLVVDLAGGLERAEATLDAEHPDAVVCMLGNEEIAYVRQWPGLEPLRGEHLRPLLARRFRRQLLEAFARQGTLPPPLAASVGALTDTRGDASGARPPLVRDEQLPAQLGTAVNVQHGPAVPPVHHVA